MKYFTVQKLNAWEEAKFKGYLTGNRNFIEEDCFLSPYIWMMEQMKKRIKDYDGEFPIWLWLDVSNICFNELLEGEWVLLEVELKEERVLLSNFVAWHHVLNNWSFEEENKEITKEQSWEYIFCKDKLESLGYDFENENLQGTIGKIALKDIKVIKYILNNKP